MDLTAHAAWAYVNHNSQFAVTSISAGQRIVAVSQSSAKRIHLECRGEPSVVNRIESSPALNPQHFTTAASITADETGAFDYFGNIDSAAKFYRVVYP